MKTAFSMNHTEYVGYIRREKCRIC